MTSAALPPPAAPPLSRTPEAKRFSSLKVSAGGGFPAPMSDARRFSSPTAAADPATGAGGGGAGGDAFFSLSYKLLPKGVGTPSAGRQVVLLTVGKHSTVSAPPSKYLTNPGCIAP